MEWNYTKENPLRVATLCSGYESQFMAIRNLGIPAELVMWAEYDPESKAPLEKQPAVIAHNAVFPEYADRNWGDMTKIDWEKAPDFDCLFYSTPCFVAGTLVLTNAGYKPVEDVKEGDYVLTHTNSFRKVLATGKKPASNILKIRAMMFDEVFCTPNHPFYTRTKYRYGHKALRAFTSPVWKEAGSLTKSDYLGLAVNGKSELPEWDGVALHRGTHWDVVNELSGVLGKKAFWYLIGRYVGDGWQRNDATHKGILIAFCEKDKEPLFDALNELGWNYTTSWERTCGRVTIYGKELCEFVNRFGRYAYGKRIDESTMNLPAHLLAAFLCGYVDSDGCFVDGEFRITTVSRELAYGVMQIVAKCYNRPSRLYKTNRPEKYIIEGREVNQRSTYVVIWHTEARKQDKAFFEDGIVWFPIKEIGQSNRKEFVYNLEVEIDHSYTANGAIVHNCQSISNAGLQHGFVEGSGTRSSIIWNVRDAIKIKRPKIAILENVKAMISSKFVDMFNLWQSELEKFGYTNFAQVLNAKDYGVPQNRERIFLVSILGDAWYNFPQPQELKLRLKDMLEEKVDEKYYLDDCKVAEFVGTLSKEKKQLICKD
jgi:intein/homing endonuclease